MIRPRLSVLSIALLASGCVIVPVTTDSFDPDCRVVTRHMELKNVEVYKFQSCQLLTCQIGVIAGAGLVAASAVVSGSIVLVGNVVYWSEHRASCPAVTAAPAAADPT